MGYNEAEPQQVCMKLKGEIPMSDNLPRRPEGMGDNDNLNSGLPRVEIESTPQPASTEGQHAAGAGTTTTSQMPFVPSTATETRTVVKTKTKLLPVFLCAFAGFAVGAVLVIALVMAGAFRITDTDVQATQPAQTIEIDPEDTTLAEAVSAKALPSVVSISTETAQGGGIGSGVILDNDGHILTNYHVVEGATGISVNVGDASYVAEIVGADESSDLAVIKLTDASSIDLTPIEIGDSDDISVGEWVMAIGSPFGNEQSVSTGIVSALYRSTAMQSSNGTTIYANMIQTDAAINPGNSGGALVNDKGELIGINSIIESYSGSSSGVGFAIPVNYAIDIANQIIDGKTPEHPYLGVSVSSVNAYNARQNNLSVSEGAFIVSVNEGSAAEAAGLKANDIVTAVDDTPVTSADGLIIALREHSVGDEVTLTVVRDGKEQEVKVTLGSDADAPAEEQDSSSGNGSGLSSEELRQYLEELLGGQGYGLGGNSIG